MKLIITPKVLEVSENSFSESCEKICSGSMLTICVEEREITYIL